MTTENVTFSSRLQYFVKYIGYKQTQMAEIMGISRDSYAKFKEGDNPSFDKITTILKAFPQLSAEWLMRGEGSMLIIDKPTELNTFAGSVNAVHVSGNANMNTNDEKYIEYLEKTNDYLRAQNEKLTNKLLGL